MATILRQCVRVGAFFAFSLAAAAENVAPAQYVGVQEISPFVVAIEAVVRNGAVGGVAVDADGILSRAEDDTSGRLKQAWIDNLQPVGDDVAAVSGFRKVSLRRLQDALVEVQADGQRPPDEMLFLAGLQEVRYVFVYPGQHDIVLAGPAEGWTVNESGAIVGGASGRTVLRLADFVVALRATDGPEGGAISCSIDPTPEGLSRLQALAARRRGRVVNASALTAFERALGPQTITITGVPAGSHFARVMAAADYQMKRLAMGLEEPPIDGLPSYLALLREAGSADTGAPAESLMPRWWLAPNYLPLLHDADEWAWELRGQRVQAMSEGGRLDGAGRRITEGQPDLVAERWAANMTRRYEALAAAQPIFAELRGSMDLAVAAALLIDRDLLSAAECDLSVLLTVPESDGDEFAAPRQVASVASLAPSGSGTIVAVSGGVDLGVGEVVDRAEEEPSLSAARAAAASPDENRWWWD